MEQLNFLSVLAPSLEVVFEYRKPKPAWWCRKGDMITQKFTDSDGDDFVFVVRKDFNLEMHRYHSDGSDGGMYGTPDLWFEFRKPPENLEQAEFAMRRYLNGLKSGKLNFFKEDFRKVGL